MLVASTPPSKDIFETEDLTICYLYETHLTNRKKHCLRMNGKKNIYQTNGPWKQAAVATFISDKVDFNLN
jgi:hypothetical protein